MILLHYYCHCYYYYNYINLVIKLIMTLNNLHRDWENW